MNNADTNLYPEYNFRFNGVKDTFDKYEIVKDSNGNTVVVDRTGGWYIGDELIIDRVKFSYSWVLAIMKVRSSETVDTRRLTAQVYEHAFSDDARKVYARIMGEIQRELTATGNINTLDVVNAAGNVPYRYARSYAESLFSSKKCIKALEKWARHAIPNALPQTKETLTYIDAVNRGYENNPKR